MTRKTSFGFSFLIVMTSSLADPMTADAYDRSYSVSVASGQRVMAFVSSNHPHCKQGSIPNLVLVKPPSNGKVTLEPAVETFRAETCILAQCKCVGKSLSGRGAFYVSNKGFKGTDYFEVYRPPLPAGERLKGKPEGLRRVTVTVH